MSPEHARSVKELVEVIATGAHPEFLFFWGHTPKAADVVDMSCLSNWFPAGFAVQSIAYATTEHFMMAEKARLFGDGAIREKILRAESPAEAKRLGREVGGFDDGIWTSRRFGIVVEGNRAKFSQNKPLAAFLQSTGSKILVEASPRDRIWGIGLGRDNERARAPSQWRGLNLLGFALMEVRAQLFPH